jgi:hypothetical protein
MGEDPSREDQLLAVALGSARDRPERRIHPDRRSGIDRRKQSLPVEVERRSGADRRRVVRRRADQAEGATLIEKARARLKRQGGLPGIRRVAR